jgi:hypothetical protein
VGDFNGDGRDDIFRYVPGSSGADVFLSDGTRFVRDGSWTGAGHGTDGWYIGDYDGDGKDDIFRYVPGVSGADVFLATCSATSSASYISDVSLLALDDDMMHDVYGLRETDMTYHEEEEFLVPFIERVMFGEEVSIFEIKKAYEDEIGQRVRITIIRQLLHRQSFWDLLEEFGPKKTINKKPI